MILGAVLLPQPFAAGSAGGLVLYPELVIDCGRLWAVIIVSLLYWHSANSTC